MREVKQEDLVATGQALLRRVDQLERDVAALKDGASERVVVLRELTRGEAKAEILDLLQQSGEDLYFSDIAERLQLDLELVVELSLELMREGQVEPAD